MIAKPTIIADRYETNVTAEHEFPSIFRSGSVHSATFSDLLSRRVPRVLPVACPPSPAGLKSEKLSDLWRYCVKTLMLVPCLLLATVLAAQTDSVTETNLPPATAQASAPVPSPQATGSLPAGTALMVRLNTTLATFSNKAGDPFRGSITQPLVSNGQTVIPAGATVEGRVTKVTEPRRISGRPTIGIVPEVVILPTGERYSIDATLTDTSIKGTDVNNEGQFKGSGHDRRDTIEQGGGTAGGMLIGGLVGGPVGILVGGAIGAGSTTGHWLGTHHSAVLPMGTELTFELNRPLALTNAATPTPAATAAAPDRSSK
jgi:hypothetical protein